MQIIIESFNNPKFSFCWSKSNEIYSRAGPNASYPTAWSRKSPMFGPSQPAKPAMTSKSYQIILWQVFPAQKEPKYLKINSPTWKSLAISQFCECQARPTSRSSQVLETTLQTKRHCSYFYSGTFSGLGSEPLAAWSMLAATYLWRKCLLWLDTIITHHQQKKLINPQEFPKSQLGSIHLHDYMPISKLLHISRIQSSHRDSTITCPWQGKWWSVTTWRMMEWYGWKVKYKYV